MITHNFYFYNNVSNMVICIIYEINHKYILLYNIPQFLCGKMEYVTSETKNGYFTENELVELRKTKVQQKISDIDYLAQHSEIEAIINDLYKKLLDTKPDSKEVYKFVAKYFIELNEERSRAMD